MLLMVNCNVSLKSRYTEGIDMKVFIADDSAVVRERLTEMLSELPEIEIIGQAEDGLEAINLIEKLNPDVVILDIRMPRGNGIDVLQNIKKNNPSLIVIMLTNYPYPQYRKKCMKAGADYFFDKSTEFEKVTEMLKKLIP
jgi:DNA-binding NarL/FixJ family response regulator